MPDIPVTVGPRVVRGGSGTPTGGGGGGTPVGKTEPLQVVGLVHMTLCSATECRDLVDPTCHCNPVFGNATAGGLAPSGSTYENDISSFLVHNALFSSNPSAATAWTLEKRNATTGLWALHATLNNNTYGILYAINTIVNHPTYSGFAINWGKVISFFGQGQYRIKATLTFGAIPSKCLVSEPFCLKRWQCEADGGAAHGTVKFETYIDGVVGDFNRKGKKFDVCTMNWYDSIRFRGFFGLAKTPEYLEVQQEYQNGQITTVHDEAIERYELVMHPFPKWLGDRFKTYGLMANRRLVSDYNVNNSDYGIRLLEVIKDSGFEPEWYDARYLRKGSVNMFFKDALQGMIKTSCCDAERPAG